METAEYVKLAEVEDRMWYFRALHSHAAGLLREHLPGARGTLLDAGCGTGGFIRRAAPWFPDLTFSGIDLYQVACDLAIERGTPRIVRASVTALPFADASMAAVTSLDVIQHIADHESAAAELHRVLEPGGLLVMNAPAFMWLWSYHDDVTHTERRYTRRGLSTLLKKAGFSVLRGIYWNFLPLPLIVAKRKLFWRLSDADDVKAYPPIAERILDAGMALERAWIRSVSRLPVGSSVLLAARKPAA